MDPQFQHMWIRSFVLHLISECSDERHDGLNRMLGDGRDWTDVVRDIFGLDNTFDMYVHRNWLKYQTAVSEQGWKGTARDFAFRLVEQKLKLLLKLDS
ncbi:MAG: hypothetical protein N2C12_03250 [Planctomycetales bacterium]